MSSSSRSRGASQEPPSPSSHASLLSSGAAGASWFSAAAVRLIKQPVMLAVDASVAAGRRSHRGDDAACREFRSSWSRSRLVQPLMLVHMTSRWGRLTFFVYLSTLNPTVGRSATFSPWACVFCIPV